MQAGTRSLEEQDPEIFNLIEAEKNRQWKCLELIASEVRVFLFSSLHQNATAFTDSPPFTNVTLTELYVACSHGLPRLLFDEQVR